MMHEPFAECEEEPPQQDEQKQEEAQPALPQQPQQPPQASPRLPPGQGAVTLDGWYFTSAFDSGNALPSSWRRETSVPRQQANGSGSTPAFSVEIARDCHGNPRVERRKAFWFYFGVMPPDPSFEGEVKFTVRRISPTVDLYAAGHKPWVSSPSARPWRRVAGEASAGPSPAHDQWDLSWRYRFDGAAAPLEPGVDGTTYFAFCAPYGYSELLEWLDRVEAVFVRNPGEECDGNATLQQGDEDAASNKAPWLWHDVDFKAGSGIYCHRQVIAISPMGRRVDLITVTETVNGLNDDWPREELPQSVEDALRGWKTPEALSELAGGTKLAQDLEKPHPFRFPGRAVCFFSGRVHPGETPAQWAINGLLRFVLSDDPRAAILRRRCVFKIVPMLNPDGVALGHTRTSSLGYDLNRCYRNPAVDQHESVFVVKEMLLGWASRGDLLLYVDCHAHTSRRGCFLFGNLQSSHPWASKDSLLWNLAYAHTLQLNSPHLDIDGCEWSQTEAVSAPSRASSRPAHVDSPPSPPATLPRSMSRPVAASTASQGGSAANGSDAAVEGTRLLVPRRISRGSSRPRGARASMSSDSSPKQKPTSLTSLSTASKAASATAANSTDLGVFGTATAAAKPAVTSTDPSRATTTTAAKPVASATPAAAATDAVMPAEEQDFDDEALPRLHCRMQLPHKQGRATLSKCSRPSAGGPGGSGDRDWHRAARGQRFVHGRRDLSEVESAGLTWILSEAAEARAVLPAGLGGCGGSLGRFVARPPWFESALAASRREAPQTSFVAK
eukprot:TRINITY_DN12577_c0_g1_i2.p1 TRINITY_DN12577_c0_g1~~TRINITY_DN12577_c0_g1_i2.p1  ORF type:complete len:784 (-),score=125.16 TRINITY_DN12577_c0_g1_i2:591-2942(-)